MTQHDDPSFDGFDEIHFPRPAETGFDRVLARALARRGFLGGALALGGIATLGGAMGNAPARAQSSRFAFAALPASGEDTVRLPPGYKAEIVLRWGDPLWSDGAGFDPETRGTAASQDRAFGDNTDGMGRELFETFRRAASSATEGASSIS